MPHKRLFIPGPTEVRSENLAALARPQVDDSLGELDSDLEAVFDAAEALPSEGPPKDDELDADDLVVELLDD